MDKSLNNGIQILIVEDSVTQRELLRYLLDEQGYHTVVKGNGLDALDSMRKCKPSLVLTDIMMPGMDGLTLCRTIKEDEQLKDIPVILMTALEDIENIGKGLEAGADNFIYKPYNPKTLISRIDFILKHPLRIPQKNKEKICEFFGGKKYFINSPKERFPALIISSIEEAAELHKQVKKLEEELQKVNEKAKTAASQNSLIPQRKDALILVVDDDPIHREVLIKQLNILGYAAEGAESGKEALSMWEPGRYALIFTDYNMPGMMGYVLASKIREKESLQALTPTPIVACTANELNSVREKCRTSGMNDFLVKPVQLIELKNLFAQWLSPPEETPIDHSLLINIVGENEVAIREILIDFKETNSKDISLLLKAMKMNNLSLAMEMAHRVKGACQLIGAKKIVAICQNIEEASRQGEEKKVANNLEILEKNAARVFNYIEKFLN